MGIENAAACRVVTELATTILQNAVDDYTEGKICEAELRGIKRAIRTMIFRCADNWPEMRRFVEDAYGFSRDPDAPIQTVN